MKSFSIILATFFFFSQTSFSQSKGYTPKLEPCDCAFKADTSVKTTCGYLIVPENRSKPTGKTIKLPYSYVSSNNPNKKHDVVLYTTGGPGGSSLGSVRNTHRRSFIKDRDYIAFEQRGTRFALPCLQCGEISDALKTAYANNLSKDSMLVDGVSRCRKRLIAEGIDITAYNTAESAADIEDLRVALHIDSLDLMGISYSGGLMMTVLHNYPWGVRSLILDSPLPEFINIDEEEILNFNEALNTIFAKCETDSTNKDLYGNLKQRFIQYFTSIQGKTFTINYTPQGETTARTIQYTRNELTGVLENTIFNFSAIKDVPFIITEFIKGNHQPYIKSLLDGIFSGSGPNGMRLSVYCSDKMAYANEAMINQQFVVRPYVAGAGYFINDVNMAMCKCWAVPPVPAQTKKAFYSNVPVLLAAGDTDPSCRPLYNDMIAHYMPNAQRLLFINKSHGAMLNLREGDSFIGQFLNDPYTKVQSAYKDIVVY